MPYDNNTTIVVVSITVAMTIIKRCFYYKKCFSFCLFHYFIYQLSCCFIF